VGFPPAQLVHGGSESVGDSESGEGEGEGDWCAAGGDVDACEWYSTRLLGFFDRLPVFGIALA
jgi:hypothetical protein